MKLLNRWRARRRSAPHRPRRQKATLPRDERFLGCGWFDSSHELRQGLRITEQPALYRYSLNE